MKEQNEDTQVDKRTDLRYQTKKLGALGVRNITPIYQKME
jgi:hypothetical protein